MAEPAKSKCPHNSAHRETTSADKRYSELAITYSVHKYLSGAQHSSPLLKYRYLTIHMSS